SKQLPHLSVNSSDEVFAACDKEALHKADAVHFARDLCTEPASELTPALYAERLTQEFAQTDVKVEIIEDEALTFDKCPDIHTVAKGSSEANKLAVLTLKRDDNQEKMALVGKRLPFDSGGINAKTARDIGDMK